MELPGSGYLYTLATLAMTFVGFCAVVFVLRQTRARDSARFQVVHSHGYIEIALGSAGAAMLPPLLALCEMPPLAIWRWSSAIVAIGFALHTCFILARFYKITRGRFPVHVWINSVITMLAIAAFGRECDRGASEAECRADCRGGDLAARHVDRNILADFGRISLTRARRQR